jgi:xanthine/CO dehydrogenase XdhC/CoxF family maturation factor
MHEITKTINACRRIIASGQRGVLVTILSTNGSTYRRAGARAVLNERGGCTGAISGGCIENDLRERADLWLEHAPPRVVTYDATRPDDIVFGLGLGCRGTMQLLIEPFDAARPPRIVNEFQWNGRQPVTWLTILDGRVLLTETILPEPSLVIFGGGPDVAPVARIAEAVGWRVAVIRTRDVHPEDVAEKVDLGAFDAAVIMTHNYLYDLTLLSATLPSGIEYVGLLGPKSRGDELLAQIENITPAMRAKLHSPIGLDVGADTPEEIALSIVAEVQAVLRQRSGTFLRDVSGPIHESACA